MNKPTADLIGEHSGILLILKVMEKISKRLHDGESVNRDHLGKITEFLRNFADRCHHGKEEGILFPEMAKNASNAKLVNELLGEHMTGRDYIRGMVESLEKYDGGNPHAFHIAENGLGYIRLLTEHIRKENEILFPIADREIPDAVQSEMLEKFETLERDVIGEGKHEEYHGWLKELKGIYLV